MWFLSCSSTQKREQLQRRIRRLISDLYVPEAEDRDRAATELGRIGIEAKAAIPDLIKALEDDSKDVQLAAIEAYRITLRSTIDLDERFDVKDKNVVAALQEVYDVPGREFWEARNELKAAAEYALSRILNDEQGTENRKALLH
ncbi:HEAT repeat domain-containing protein [Nostoc ellipsosporum NOK]|nr:HEAT repeat domain-containing protein [Nostoc ellipsosporum NOK]